MTPHDDFFLLAIFVGGLAVLLAIGAFIADKVDRRRRKIQKIRGMWWKE